MLVLKIGEKEYKIEYSIEASLATDCVEQITNTVCGLNNSLNKNPILLLLGGVKNKPKTALAMLYSGLLEHHGTASGDGSITCENDAKKLMKQYFSEHKDDGAGNYHALYSLLIGQMEDDGFFDLIGLEQTMNDITELVEKIKEVQTKNKPKK